MQCLSFHRNRCFIQDITVLQGYNRLQHSFQLFSVDHIAWLLVSERIVYEASIDFHGIEHIDRCRLSDIRLVTFPYKFDLPCVFKFERILFGKYVAPSMIATLSKRWF